MKQATFLLAALFLPLLVAAATVSTIPRAATTYSIEIYSNGAMVSADYEVFPSNSANNTAWVFLPFVPSDIGSVLLLPASDTTSPSCFVSGINYAEQEWTTSRELFENLFGRRVIVTVRSGTTTENIVGTWRSCLGNKICIVNGEQTTVLMNEPERVTLVEGEEMAQESGILLPPPAAPYPSTFTPIQVRFLNQSSMRFRSPPPSARGSQFTREAGRPAGSFPSDPSGDAVPSRRSGDDEPAVCSLNSLFPIRGVTWSAQHTLRLSRDASVANVLTQAIVQASFQKGPLPPQPNPPPVPMASKYDGGRVGAGGDSGGIIPPPKPPKPPRPENPHLAAVINGRRVYPSRISFMTGNLMFPSGSAPIRRYPAPQFAKARAYGGGAGSAEAASFDGGAPQFSNMDDMGEHQMFVPAEDNLSLPVQGTSTFTLFATSGLSASKHGSAHFDTESEQPRVNRRLRMNAETMHSGFAPEDTQRAHPEIVITLNNTRANDLGQQPFPTGQVLVYREGSDGNPHYLGMSTMTQDIPVGSRLEVAIGQAGNVECTYLSVQKEQGMGGIWSGRVQIQCTQYATEGLLQKIRAGEEAPLIRRIEVIDRLPGPGQVIQFESDPKPSSTGSNNLYRWNLAFDELDDDGTTSVEITYSYRTQLR